VVVTCSRVLEEMGKTGASGMGVCGSPASRISDDISDDAAFD